MLYCILLIAYLEYYYMHRIVEYFYSVLNIDYTNIYLFIASSSKLRAAAGFNSVCPMVMNSRIFTWKKKKKIFYGSYVVKILYFVLTI
jgi:hypothetical protein